MNEGKNPKILLVADYSNFHATLAKGLPKTVHYNADIPVYLILLLFSAFLILTSSNDGWLRMEFPRMDTSWFFMAGKAWMNGMTPYSDFTDSKGPLLWLSYGLGYLISPRSMHGMFFIETLFYWGTFVFIYKTLRLFTEDNGTSMLGSMTMALFFFQPWIHFEVRAEDFCQFFNAMTFYSLATIFKKNERGWRPYFYMGVGFGGALMIKYNIALMLLLPSACVLTYLLFTARDYAFRATLKWLAGAGCIILPFIIYFIIAGCLRDFINEYFVLTYHTIEIQHPHASKTPTFWGTWPFILVKYTLRRSFDWTLAIKLPVFSLLFLLSKRFRPLWFRATILMWFVSTLILSTYMQTIHYLNNLAIFCILPVIFIFAYFRRITYAAASMAGMIVICIVSVGLTYFPQAEFSDVTLARQLAQDNSNMKSIIETHTADLDRQGTIMYVKTFDTGLDIETELLPGSKYWSQQAGATRGMEEEHIADLFEKRPDFVIIPYTEEGIISELEKRGYEKAYTYKPIEYVLKENIEDHHLYVKKSPE